MAKAQETPVLDDSNATTLLHCVVIDNVWCNKKRYKKGDAFDAELTEIQLNALLELGVIAKQG